MSAYCLGQLIAPIFSSRLSDASEVPQVGFLQRGRTQVHVYGTRRIRIGDLSPGASKQLGPLLGPISSCSAPVTSKNIPAEDQSLMKIHAFVVIQRGVQPQLGGCVFSRLEHIQHIQTAFAAAHLELTPLRNYNPSLYFDIPHFASDMAEAAMTANNAGVATALQQCRTKLKAHQLTALEFLRTNESSVDQKLALWRHPGNVWLRRFTAQAGINTPDNSTKTQSQGSILADDMGLGKKLTSLTFILASADFAVQFQWEDWITQSAATLVICPQATLSNWEHEIRCKGHVDPH
ncbi:hypothetical protein PTTG_28320 [Puccinia triticina 1-1 BBBD Race 1]|uniref:SNF2_N domain-containing protein n=1 Tax=Puccinia triticina (isolate 1-1 / race 1 (BBBD)) TaxID=630390 RepID=A0A180GCY7_PUCT1|nr:hypothetical protein PTTG_28320 [Puccinia triticina 1-1 BBBD Race 1]